MVNDGKQIIEKEKLYINGIFKVILQMYIPPSLLHIFSNVCWEK